MGSKYTNNAFATDARPQCLVYLEPRERVWWLQMSSYFYYTKSNKKLCYHEEHSASPHFSRHFTHWHLLAARNSEPAFYTCPIFAITQTLRIVS